MKIIDQDLYKPWGNSDKLPENFSVADADYFCPTLDILNNELFPKYWRWLASIRLTKWMHKWDCDNFADSFRLFCCGYYQQVIESDANGIAVGVIYYNAVAKAESGISGGHAINIVYIDDGKNPDGSNAFHAAFIEPQNGQIYQLTKQEFDSIWTVYI